MAKAMGQEVVGGAVVGEEEGEGGGGAAVWRALPLVLMVQVGLAGRPR